MEIKRFYIIIAILMCSTLSMLAQKPKWISNTPKELNYTYKFVKVVADGASVESARNSAEDRLASDEQLKEGVAIYRNKKSHEDTYLSRTNKGALQENKLKHITVDLVYQGVEYNLQAYKVDEYIERISGGYRVYSLYQVATCEDPVFDRTYLSSSYGAGAAAMSIIPGLGQMYKGSYLKGGLMMAGTAAGVVSVLLCENQRADYKNKIKQQAQFAKDYNTKASNWETARNVAIGVTAAIYIYNLIDAAAAKGARRVIVKKANGNNLSFHPVATPYSAGAALTYNF